MPIEGHLLRVQQHSLRARGYVSRKNYARENYGHHQIAARGSVRSITSWVIIGSVEAEG